MVHLHIHYSTVLYNILIACILCLTLVLSVLHFIVVCIINTLFFFVHLPLTDRHEPSTASMSPTRGDSMHTHYNTSGNPPSSVTAPPIAGFVPRQTEIQFRDDIRRMQVRNDVCSYRILNTPPQHRAVSLIARNLLL